MNISLDIGKNVILHHIYQLQSNCVFLFPVATSKCGIVHSIPPVGHREGQVVMNSGMYRDRESSYTSQVDSSCVSPGRILQEK